MSQTDAELIAESLYMRANYIETNNVFLSAVAAEERNKSINTSSRIERRNFVQINALSKHEIELVERLRALGSNNAPLVIH